MRHVYYHNKDIVSNYKDIEEKQVKRRGHADPH